MKINNRIDFVDNARGIAMLLVILGHCQLSSDCTIEKLIYSFHMPLFFFLSGMFATSSNRVGNVWEGVKKKAKRILIPQIAVCLLGIIQPLINFVVNKSPLDYMYTFSFFRWWFLPTLFLCSTIFMLIDYKLDMNKLVNNLFLLFMSILFIPFSIKANVYCFTGTLLCLQIVPMAMFYYVLGNILCHYTIKISEERTIMKSIVFISLASMTVVLANLNSTVMMYKNEYGNIFLFLCSSISGIASCLFFSMFVNKGKLLTFIGKHSIAFYVWQFIITAFFMKITNYALSTLLNIQNNNIVATMAFSLSLPILYAVVVYTTKEMPYLYGLNRYGKRKSL